MGSFFTDGASRRDIIDELSEAWTHPETGTTNTTVARYLRGYTMYAVHEIADKDKTKVERYACVYLLMQDRSGWWGYKPLEERCGPCYYDMPKKHLLMLTPTDHKWANEWREACWKKHGMEPPKEPGENK
ncbi:MAG: hypothetical protein GY753_06935 [Gammaproteobacteria bacterium]|nr:hypothetical protein [Gammaproteobacteria bacterium]